MLKLGFRYGDRFLALLDGKLSTPELVKVKSTVIAGLHAMQGLKIGRNETMLYLVDPAFGKASADAAIIARQIPSSSEATTSKPTGDGRRLPSARQSNIATGT